MEGWGEGPRDHLRFYIPRDWQFSGLQFITVEGYKGESAKGKGAWGKVHTQPRTSFKHPLAPSGGTEARINSSSQELQEHMWNVFYQLSSLEIQCSRILLGIDHIGTLYLAHRKVLDSQKEYKCWEKPHCLYKELNTVSHSNSSGSYLNFSTFVFQDTTQGPTLLTSLSKDVNFRPAVLTLLCLASD